MTKPQVFVKQVPLCLYVYKFTQEVTEDTNTSTVEVEVRC